MKTFLDWSAYHDAGMGDAYADIPKTGGDFAKAVSVCINSRLCENEAHKGVMCPSYRLTGNRHFSTGGRVRLLKAALNGESGQWPFADPTLAEAMDLCVSCKGCKRECENEVDMAMIKVEYLAQCNQVTGFSFRAQLFAHLPRWLGWPLARRLPALRNRLPRLARWGERLLGVSAKVALPEPAPRPFRAPTAGAATDAAVPEVVLLVDTFTRHFQPEVAQAALEVLEAAGYRVLFAEPAKGERRRPLCCGRTYLAQGMVEEAKAEARCMLRALSPHVAAGRTIIGLEPACLLALRDEWKMLDLGDEAARLAPSALLFEEFLARETPPKPLVFSERAVTVLVHGHCHQKAVGAMKSMRKVLKLVPGLDFELIEASCCGMSGSFGLEAEHADMSLYMAQQALLPKLHTNPDATVVSNGFSCRHQIRRGSGRGAQHVAEILREALAN